MGYENEEDLKQTIYDHLRTIRDPEKPSTLEVNWNIIALRLQVNFDLSWKTLIFQYKDNLENW